MSEALARPCPMTLPPSETTEAACRLEEGHEGSCAFRMRARPLPPPKREGNVQGPIAGEIIDVDVVLEDGVAEAHEARADAFIVCELILAAITNPLDAKSWMAEARDRLAAALLRARAGR
jgi:hypothetical protein